MNNDITQKGKSEKQKRTGGSGDEFGKKSLLLSVPLTGFLFWYLFSTETDKWYDKIALILFLICIGCLLGGLAPILIDFQGKVNNSTWYKSLPNYLATPLFWLEGILFLSVLYGGFALFVWFARKMELMNE